MPETQEHPPPILKTLIAGPLGGDARDPRAHTTYLDAGDPGAPTTYLEYVDGGPLGILTSVHVLKVCCDLHRKYG
jgi:hypothetical protein